MKEQGPVDPELLLYSAGLLPSITKKNGGDVSDLY